MIKIVICDDDIDFANHLKATLEKMIDFQIKIDIYTTSFELIEKIYTYDILFIDYDLPYINGLELLKRIENYPIIKIMVSNYNQICFKTYQYKLFWFVRKKNLHKDLSSLIPYLKKEVFENIEKKLVIASPNKCLSIEFNKINYIETTSNYLQIHTTFQTFKIRSSFSSIISQFDNNVFFIPIHGIIINVEYIEFIDFHNSIIYLKNGKLIPISRSKKKGIKESYGKYINHF